MPGANHHSLDEYTKLVSLVTELGKVLIEFPVTIGLAGALLLPVWAAVGAVAAMVTKCTIEVERTDDDESDEGDTDAAEPVVVEAEIEEEPDEA